MKKLTIVLSLLAFLASTLIAQNDIPRFSKMGPQIIKHDTFSEQYLTSEREHKFNYYDETEIEDINMSVNLYSDNSFRLDSILGYDYYSISNGLDWKKEYTYDSNGNLTLDKESWWDTDLNDWEVHWKSEYYWSIPSEVGELNINDIFTVFPNPTSGNLSIKGEVFLNQHVILEMTNLRGQSVYSNKLFLTNIDHNIILPKLPKGMYLLTIKANSINSTQKIFIE
jgi:hypothetical protein